MKIENNIPFVAYSLPYKRGFYLIAQNDPEIIKYHNYDFLNKKGFVLFPFKDTFSQYPALFIREDKKRFFEANENLTDNVTFHSNKLLELNDLDYSYNAEYGDKEYFKKIVSQAIASIKNDQVDKVVLSRKRAEKLPKDINIFSVFDKLRGLYPNAFNYIFYTPSNGFWLGATPETLIHYQNYRIYTEALAGTKGENSDTGWTIKEKNEQEFVSRHIKFVLNDNNIQLVKEKGPETIRAGKLYHLKTTFKAVEKQESDIEGLLRDLHPTPAVCGLPRNQSMSMIDALESYERGYYTGFLGPLNGKKDFNFFVNLRCAQIIKDNLITYAGAGITEDSNPEAEYEETEKKRKILSRGFVK
ncbi:MAG: isochorismate synthase [Flavobacteriales bacterium]